MMQKEGFTIQDRSETGREWEAFTFEQWALKLKEEGKPYKISAIRYMRSLLTEIFHQKGIKKGSFVFIKTLIWNCVFNKPHWAPDKFNISSRTQEDYYRNKFYEYKPIIVFFETLAKEIGEKKADRLIPKTMIPIVLDMMKSKYQPVESIHSVESWLSQARNYLGGEIEKDKGFSGTIFLAKDKSELRFHVTRCAPMQMLRAYGLGYTASALCMCDHITYHTVFPNLIFKRSHALAIGDDFCDHESRIRKESDPIQDEDNYSDCGRDHEFRELVREWEEKAKILFFGSQEAWEEYAKRCRN